MIVLNPPRSRKTTTKRSTRKTPRRSAGGRFVKSGAKSKATTRRKKPMATRRKKRAPARRRTTARKTTRRAVRRNPPRRKARRKTARRRAPARRRAVRRNPPRKRAYRRRKRSAGPHFSTYKTVIRQRGVKRGNKTWRRRKKYVRNPALLPSMSVLKGYVVSGLTVYGGWVGVNAVMMGLDRFGLGQLKAGKSPNVVAGINFVARLLSIAPVAIVAAKLGIKSREKIVLGGAFNAVYHAGQDLLAAAPGSVPTWGAELMLGYDADPNLAGMGAFMAVPRGVAGYMTPSSISKARAGLAGPYGSPAASLGETNGFA